MGSEWILWLYFSLYVFGIFFYVLVSHKILGKTMQKIFWVVWVLLIILCFNLVWMESSREPTNQPITMPSAKTSVELEKLERLAKAQEAIAQIEKITKN